MTFLPPPPPLEFCRVDPPWGDRDAEYQLACRECKLAVKMSANRELVRRPEPGSYDREAPRRSQFRTDDAYAATMLVSIMCGDAEKRRRDEEVDRIEQRFERDLRRELDRCGCPHAHPGGPEGARKELVDLREAVNRAGFRVAKNLAHPFLGPTPEDRPTLWCVSCGRDSGYHHEGCEKKR